MWTILERFGNMKAFDELNYGSGIHRLENVLTLNHDVHFMFDTFRLWLEPVIVRTVSNSPPFASWSFIWVFTGRT